MAVVNKAPTHSVFMLCPFEGCADIPLACRVCRVPPIVLADKSPGPVQALLGHLQQARLVRDADILKYNIERGMMYARM